MSHLQPHPVPARRHRALPVNVAASGYAGIAILLFFALSLATFFVFTSKLVADELAPEAPGSIAGMVKGINGEPLVNIQVVLYRKSLYSSDYWDVMRSVTTQVDGKYYFTVLPVGNYRIGASDPKGMHASTFYPMAPIVSKAADIIVTGNQINDIDLILQPGGQITGIVTTTVGFSLTAGIVALHHEVKRQGISSWEAVQFTALPIGGGTYTFTNLSANIYRICASGLGVILATSECYDNVYDINRASSFTLTGSETISKVDIVLGDGADYSQISGRVTTLNDEPLENIEVYAVRDTDQPFARTKRSAALPSTSIPIAPLSSTGGPPYEYYGYPYVRTDSQGNYRLGALSEGNYRLIFRDPTGTYAFEYYNDSLVPERATMIPLAARQSISDINVQLAIGGHIRGMATIAGQPAPIQYVNVQIKTPSGWQFATDSNSIANDAHYDIGGLPAGVYRLWTSAYIADFYTSYFYQGYYFNSNAVDPNEVYPFTEIPVAVGETTTADIVLLGGPQFEGSLSGLVTADGVSLAGAKVSLYPQDSTCCAPPPGQPLFYVLTDAAGRYTINGLTSSSFRLGVADPAGVYATTYYTAHILSSSANVLTVEDGHALTNINVDLPLAGAISGRVVRPNGQGVSDLLVSILILTTYDSTSMISQQISNEIRTDATGRYTVKGLHPGDYQVCFADTQRGYNKCYGMLWWTYNFNSGHIKVAAGVTTADIDLLWGPDFTNYLPIIAQ